jgi:hypothetical protein
MSGRVDDEALRLERDAVRRASQPGEIVAASPDELRSFWFYVRRALLRGALWFILVVVATFAVGVAVELLR